MASRAMDEERPPIQVPERQGVIEWGSIPRRIVTIWLPLALFVLVLLFPFYWMTVTTFKSNAELYNFKEYNPLWVHSPTLENVNKLLFQTDYPQWLLTTMTVAIVATLLSMLDGRTSTADLIARLAQGRDEQQAAQIARTALAALEILYVDGTVERAG